MQRVIAGYDPADPYSRAAALRATCAAARCRPRSASRWPTSARCASRTSPRPTPSRRRCSPPKPVDIAPVPGDRPPALRRPLGGRTHRRAARRRHRAPPGHPASGHPRHPGSGLTRLTVDAFDAFHAAAPGAPAGGGAVRRVRRAAAADRAVLPDARRGRGRSARAQLPPRHLHQFRQSVRPRRVRRADRASRRTALPIGGVLLGPAWSEGRLAPLADALHRRFTDTVGATGQRCRRRRRRTRWRPTRPRCSASARICRGCR